MLLRFSRSYIPCIYLGKSHRISGRIAGKGEIVILGIGEFRVGDDRIIFKPLRLEIVKGKRFASSVKHNGRSLFRPDKVISAAEGGTVKVPFGNAVNRAAVGQEYILFENYRKMPFEAGHAAELPARVGKDIVADDVHPSVMLVVAVVGAIVADVVFECDISRTFVGIQRPAAVILALYVMDYVAGNNGAGSCAEQINAAHVGKFALTQIEDMIFEYQIVAGDRRSVSPDPSAGYAGVI